jgi:hypothetical protein
LSSQIANLGDLAVHHHGCFQRWSRRGKARHHRVSNGLDHRAAARGDHLAQQAEMLADEAVCVHVAHPRVELGRAFDISEEDGQGFQPQTTLRGNALGAEEIAKYLGRHQLLDGHRREAALEDGGGNGTSWSSTGCDTLIRHLADDAL